MAIIKWDPLNDANGLQDRIDKLFDDSFPHCARGDGNLSDSAWTPRADIYETERNVIISLDLPGVHKEDICLEMKDNSLTISGQRKVERQCPVKRYYRRERTCGPFRRVFSLHAVVEPEQIRARFKIREPIPGAIGTSRPGERIGITTPAKNAKIRRAQQLGL